MGSGKTWYGEPGARGAGLRGTKELNSSLSTRRSAAVEAWLIAHGVDGTHLTHAGYGDDRPVGDNTTEEGRAKNRRVELVKI